MDSSDVLKVEGRSEEAARDNIGEVVAQFIEHCRNAKGLSAHTINAYESDLRDFSGRPGLPASLPEVDRDFILAYVSSLRDARGLCESTVKRRIATLKILFRWLEREGIVKISVFHAMDLSIRLPKRLPRALEAREMHLLLSLSEAEASAAGKAERYDKQLIHAAVIVLFTTGLRISELVTLQMAEVSIQEASLLVHGKGNRERRVYLPSRSAIKVLKKFVGERRRVHGADRLLVTGHGLPVTAQWVRIRLRTLAERAKLARRVTPHMLRHTAATQLLEAGVDIRYVQRLLGHSSIATTQIYTQVTDVSLRAQLLRANTLERIRRAG
jgi:site-specific recombinase XerD